MTKCKSSVNMFARNYINTSSWGYKDVCLQTRVTWGPLVMCIRAFHVQGEDTGNLRSCHDKHSFKNKHIWENWGDDLRAGGWRRRAWWKYELSSPQISIAEPHKSPQPQGGRLSPSSLYFWGARLQIELGCERRGCWGLTWLNLRVKATTFGAELCFSFLFQPQLESSCKQQMKSRLRSETKGTLWTHTCR